jgi:hypothetical protein
MSIEFARSFLLWCTVINYGILLVWFLIFAIARDRIRRFHCRWFRLSDEQFDFLHYVGMSIYKIEFFCSTWCHWLFYGSSAEDGRSWWRMPNMRLTNIRAVLSAIAQQTAIVAAMRSSANGWPFLNRRYSAS